ncbi:MULTISPECIES: hypothetical protein [Streptomyces]|uniref:Uncharacterized protein n=1 Tax=Streptomyces morookaense TaxID=1970 RepID=A0A7Y7B075_STRMO|nr:MULTISPECIES: hypothetical protein [Streptomyces]MCC2274368.1 hypothetical protein [Streptomyces sp. ET3-23]NVK76557.1 hypothetical protein [Streptomyces morookaense]GHF07954.1 hypothetical protein GCM10010359_06440 [Streptomyces morookaense]
MSVGWDDPQYRVVYKRLSSLIAQKRRAGTFPSTPADLDRPGLRQYALQSVGAALAAGECPCAYAELVRLRRPLEAFR